MAEVMPIINLLINNDIVLVVTVGRRDVVTNDDDARERPGRAFLRGLARGMLELRQDFWR